MKKRIDYWQKLEGGLIYHVYNRSVGETDLYRNDENYRFFLKKWQTYLGQYAEVLAYCLMPNHFHFMIKIKPLNKAIKEKVGLENTVASDKLLQQKIEYTTFLEDQFKRLFSSYSLAFNKQHHRKGTLFQKRFKRVCLNHSEIVVSKLFYIHHNPIHHGFTINYDEWKYISYKAYFSTKSTKIAKSLMFDIFKSTLLHSTKEIIIALKKAHEVYRQNRRDELLGFDDFE